MVEKVMFLDESGVHWEEPGSDHPVFVLGGVITTVTYAKTVIDEELAALKVTHFGDAGVVLHTSDIIRNKGPFECLKDPERRAAFFDDLNGLMRRLDYKVVACCIRKDEYAERYGAAALDPYERCLSLLVERFCYEIGRGGRRGWIVAECRRPDLDAKLLEVWNDLHSNGTHFVSGADVSKRIRDLLYRKESDNIGGLQLADLVVSPIGRHVIGKPDREDFHIVESKFRRIDGDDYRGCGLVTLPRE